MTGMAERNQSHEAMLRRHRSAMIRFAAASKLSPEKTAFVIADADSRLGRATKQSGIITTERASFVLPIAVNDIPKFAEVIGAPEVGRLRDEHGAVPVLLIDAEDRATVAWERLLPPQRTPTRNRSINLLGDRDRA